MFSPNYQRIVRAATNQQNDIVPLYDHIISWEIISQITNNPDFPSLATGNKQDLAEFYRLYGKFLSDMEYDVLIYEGCISGILEGGGALGRHIDPAIKDWDDFRSYPFENIKERYFQTFTPHFEAIHTQMPSGMKGIGGVGNGIFEVVQDLVGYENLCIMLYDEPELVTALFQKLGSVMADIWTEFAQRHGDDFCVFRHGDDLGFNTQTLLPPQVIEEHIYPVYKKIVDIAHRNNKPFLLHSCGNLFAVMDKLIDYTGIDAKHSNEDAIAPFQEWIDRYGDRIGNFGGIDTDVICSDDVSYVSNYVENVYRQAENCIGVALGTGNSVPNYVSLTGYLTMNETVRRLRSASK